MTKIGIYRIGIVLLGLSYYFLKSKLGGEWMFLAVMIAILVALSTVAHRYGK